MSPKQLRAVEHVLDRLVDTLVRLIGEVPDGDPLDGELGEVLALMEDAQSHVLDRLA